MPQDEVLQPEALPDAEAGEVTEASEFANTHSEDTDSGDTEPGWIVAVRAAQSRQAIDIRLIDLRGVTTFTDYFLVCSGSNTRQNQAITDAIETELRKTGERPHCIEGYENGEWILSDYSDFLVHVFTPASREYYGLERLWREGKDMELPADAAGPAPVALQQ